MQSSSTPATFFHLGTFFHNFIFDLFDTYSNGVRKTSFLIELWKTTSHKLTFYPLYFWLHACSFATTHFFLS